MSMQVALELAKSSAGTTLKIRWSRTDLTASNVDNRVRLYMRFKTVKSQDKSYRCDWGLNV